MSDDGLDWVRKEMANSMGSDPLSMDVDLNTQIDEEEKKGTKIFWSVIAITILFTVGVALKRAVRDGALQNIFPL